MTELQTLLVDTLGQITKLKKIFPVNEVTRTAFTDELQIQMIDINQFNAPPDTSLSFFLTGFATSGFGKVLHIFGGIAFPNYDHCTVSLFPSTRDS